MNQMLMWWYKTVAIIYGLSGKEKKVLVPFGCFAAVFNTDDGIRLLLVHHNYGQKLWSLPGGGLAHIGESADKAAERETLEESGLKVKAIKLIALLSLRKSIGTVALFLAKPLNSGVKLESDNPEEIDQVDFFTIETIHKMYDQGLIYKAQYDLAMLAFNAPLETVYEWPKNK